MDWDTVDLDTKLFIYYNITHPRKYDLVDVSRFLTRFFNARLVMIAWSVQLQY